MGEVRESVQRLESGVGGFRAGLDDAARHAATAREAAQAAVRQATLLEAAAR